MAGTDAKTMEGRRLVHPPFLNTFRTMDPGVAFPPGGRAITYSSLVKKHFPRLAHRSMNYEVKSENKSKLHVFCQSGHLRPTLIFFCLLESGWGQPL